LLGYYDNEKGLADAGCIVKVTPASAVLALSLLKLDISEMVLT
jgi:hypothetical protein